MARFTARADVAERRTRVLAMRVEQRTYAEIAEALGITPKVAEADYRRSLEQRKREQDDQAQLNAARQLATLDVAERAAWEVLRRQHVTVQNGKIVGRFTGWVTDPGSGDFAHDTDGKRIPVIDPIEDDAPILNAIDRILKIAERRAKLLGLDAPTKVEVSDAVDAEIARLAADLAAGLADLEPAGETAAPGDAAAGEGGPPAP